jgi:hypothetical protein
MPILRSCPVCGTEFQTTPSRLKEGKGKYCSRACDYSSKRRHCSTHPQEYWAYYSARGRCDPRTKNLKHRKNYSERGIEFRFESFQQFFDELGPRPEGMSLDRIDNDGHYEPGNVRWATGRQQHRNRRGLNLITYEGKTLSMSEWARELNVSRNVLEYRLKKGGWTIDHAVKAFSTHPVHPHELHH